MLVKNSELQMSFQKCRLIRDCDVLKPKYILQKKKKEYWLTFNLEERRHLKGTI